ncbi:hypothetical protein [Halococcus sp. IIIV-5B]|uniref:hypothetical protein n=1 Tax=Halococcus sp. IIIV-5B TaxID=2321230 RepID=UPI001F1F308F|nr:hypothetical protein [Halococcus sp. IIIV-5B]
MGVQIGRALSTGLGKTLTKAGLVFAVVLSIVQIALLATTYRLTEVFLASLDLPPGPAGTSTSIPMSVPVSATTAGVLFVVVLLVIQVISIVLIRVMAADRQAITRESYTRRMGWVTLNSIAASLVVSLLTLIGFVLLVIPGLFLAMSLLFAVIYVADEDESFVGGIRRSWSLASGNRWRLFGLYLVVMVLFMVVSFATGFVLPSASTASSVVTAVLTAVLTVYLMAVLTDAYRQLRDDTRADQGTDPDRSVAGT